MPARDIAPGPTGSHAAASVAQLRNRLKISTTELSRRLDEAGQVIAPTGITRLEKGTRRIDVDDLMALALTLDVTPNRLLLPAEKTDRDVALAPKVSTTWENAWRWASGDEPLPVEGEKHVDWARRIVDFQAQARPHDNPGLGAGAISARETYEVLDRLEDVLRAAYAAGLSSRDIHDVVEHALNRRKWLPSGDDDER